jgi:hypothetical protein
LCWIEDKGDVGLSPWSPAWVSRSNLAIQRICRGRQRLLHDFAVRGTNLLEFATNRSVALLRRGIGSGGAAR